MYLLPYRIICCMVWNWLYFQQDWNWMYFLFFLLCPNRNSSDYAAVLQMCVAEFSFVYIDESFPQSYSLHFASSIHVRNISVLIELKLHLKFNSREIGSKNACPNFVEFFVNDFGNYIIFSWNHLQVNHFYVECIRIDISFYSPCRMELNTVR